MNKFVVLCLIFIASISYGQEDDKVIEDRNELKLNAIYLLSGIPEITYERILTNDSSIGVSAAVAIGENPFYNFFVTPYYRLYFAKRRVASGFFMELSTSIYAEDSNYYDYDAAVYVEDEFGGYYVYDVNDDKYELGMGLGIAVGGKLMLRNGWFGEIYGGAGRNFINVEKISNVYPRGGITLGKRF